MTERKLQRNRRGFTLTEVLLALAILIILLALAMIPISRHQRNIRQTELDSKAETIYLAAQNRLSHLQASGRSDEYGKDRASVGTHRSSSWKFSGSAHTSAESMAT